MKNYLIFIFLLNFISCDNLVSLDNTFSISGFIYNDSNVPVDSAEIEICEIDASENHPSLDKIGTKTYSNVEGYYYTGVVCGTTWEENSLSNKKTYTKYIRSMTIKVSKLGYLDTVITVSTDNLEETNKTLDVVLKFQ